jgi:hypothetical protein
MGPAESVASLGAFQDASLETGWWVDLDRKNQQVPCCHFELLELDGATRADCDVVEHHRLRSTFEYSESELGELVLEILMGELATVSAHGSSWMVFTPPLGLRLTFHSISGSMTPPSQ